MKKRLLTGLLAVALLGFAGCTENEPVEIARTTAESKSVTDSAVPTDTGETGSDGTTDSVTGTESVTDSAVPTDTDDGYTKFY